MNTYNFLDPIAKQSGCDRQTVQEIASKVLKALHRISYMHPLETWGALRHAQRQLGAVPSSG